MLGDDGIDCILECVMSGARGLLLLCPIVLVLKTDAT
jgi:hypothetical protein